MADTNLTPDTASFAAVAVLNATVIGLKAEVVTLEAFLDKVGVANSTYVKDLTSEALAIRTMAATLDTART